MDKKTIIETMEAVKKLKELQNQVYKSLIDMLDEIEPMDGVTLVEEHPRTVRVMSSTISSSGFFLSPSFYIPATQKDAVKAELDKCTGDIEKVNVAIKKMLDTRYATYETEKVRLNPTTLKTVQKMQDLLSV